VSAPTELHRHDAQTTWLLSRLLNTPEALMPETDTDVLENEDILIRNLTPDDLAAVVRVDETYSGVARTDFFRARIERSLQESSIHLSLAAELDDHLVGFVTVTFFQGEFGLPDRSAVVDAIGVHPDYAKHGVGRALLDQLEMNLKALHVDSLRTEASWDNFAMLRFFSSRGFTPDARVSLQKSLH
jgi:ribosomal protein S18 acetylase RimI-like enzyme